MRVIISKKDERRYAGLIWRFKRHGWEIVVR